MVIWVWSERVKHYDKTVIIFGWTIHLSNFCNILHVGEWHLCRLKILSSIGSTLISGIELERDTELYSHSNRRNSFGK